MYGGSEGTCTGMGSGHLLASRSWATRPYSLLSRKHVEFPPECYAQANA